MRSLNPDDYKRIRRGPGFYSFVLKTNPYDIVVNYYNCSWAEADRLFKIRLITMRMLQ